MCGIVGAVGKGQVAKLLLDGLKKLEYRGYDSAGLAVIDDKNELHRLRVAGKVNELDVALQNHPLYGTTGIAHTRWATHGVPSEKNAHPFTSHGEFALVHNGIIENHAKIRQQLTQAGYEFFSDTDTEVVVHLIHKHYKQTKDFLKATRDAARELEGAYAVGVISTHDPHRLIAVRQGSPLVIGRGQGENFIASDPLALLVHTQDFIYLEDNDIADISLTNISILTMGLEPVKRDTHRLTIAKEATERGKYRHFMQKEIMEQSDAVSSCLEGRISKDHILPGIFGHKAESIFPLVENVQLIACGTSYHAALIARYWIEEFANIPCSVEVASEFRYRGIAQAPNSLFVTLSQSGETADTLAALRLAKKMGYLSTLAICNAPGSTMMRESELHFLTRAGVEIGVASTKAFITQLTALMMLTLAFQQLHSGDEKLAINVIRGLEHLPEVILEILKLDEPVAKWASDFSHKQHALFLGRGSLYPVALEGALKLKEISYIHAEGYPAGELKHGPLALVDHNMPVITMVPSDYLFEKTISNLQEVLARGGKLYVLTDKPGQLHGDAFQNAKIIAMPHLHPLLNPIMYTIPLQLLAYHVAVLKGTDVDQPRNLAKSVTVE